MINYLTGVIVGISIGYFLFYRKPCNCSKKTKKPEGMEYGTK